MTEAIGGVWKRNTRIVPQFARKKSLNNLRHHTPRTHFGRLIRGSRWVPASVKQISPGRSGHRHNPPPGRWGHEYARHLHAGGLVRAFSIMPGRIGPVWWRPACAIHSWRGSSHTAHAAQGALSLRVPKHRRNFTALNPYTAASFLPGPKTPNNTTSPCPR